MSTKKFEDTSSDCAICLEPLEGERVITLNCGHKWHFDCIAQQLSTTQPTSKQRLLFTGCQCAKCGSICDHEELSDLTRTTDILREKVDRLLQEQLALDAPDIWKKHSMTRIHCREPYFGGTVECADVLGNEQEEEERLCVACDPQSQVTCRNPLEHRGHLVWKCRYCCRPSTHLCYGNVHFCDECHARNSQRVCQLQQTAFGRSTLTGNKPPPLSPIPCLGENCPYPKPANSSKHSNGLTSQSEQVYACAFCQSTRLSPFMDEPGSRNLLHNSSGQYQLQGWRQLNPNMSWAVETSDLPVNTSTTTNFVSSYLLCVMQQILDLSTVLRIRSPNLSMEVSARYMGRTDCPSVFCLKAFLLDEHLRPITEQATPKLEAPPDYWERARLVLSTTEASRYIVVIVMGKDSRFWQGLYGSKVAEISIRLLGSTQEIERLIRPQYATTRNMISPQTIGEVGHRVREGNMDSDPPTTRTLFRDGLLPIVCLLILAWFMQN